MSGIPNAQGRPTHPSHPPHPHAGLVGTLPTMQEVQCMTPEAMNAVFKAEQQKVIDNRPFECTICGNRFRQQCHLTQHIRIHTNDRPYHCSHCEKAFKQKSQLNQHERIHTGEKPYQCPLCAKAFPQAGQLYSHKKTHGINPRVTKDPPDGADVPRRGRKRKIKNAAPIVMSPQPPVAYMIESIHRPVQNPQYPPQTNHRTYEDLKRSTCNSTQSSIDAAKSQQLMSTVKLEPAVTNYNPHERHKLIPVSRDQYQYYLQNHLYYQGQQPPFFDQHRLPPMMRTTTDLPPPPTTTMQFEKKPDIVFSSGVTKASESLVKMEGVPSHLRDLERLIPTYNNQT